MTWLFDELRDPGIPRVGRVRWTDAFNEDDWSDAWTVEFPDEWEWKCCRQTDFRGFPTWREAVRFAVNQGWKR